MLLNCWHQGVDQDVIERIISYDPSIRKHRVCNEEGKEMDLLSFLIENRYDELLHLVLLKGQDLFENVYDQKIYWFQAKAAGLGPKFLHFFQVKKPRQANKQVFATPRRSPRLFTPRRSTRLSRRK
jgi:hypothetical protein